MRCLLAEVRLLAPLLPLLLLTAFLRSSVVRFLHLLFVSGTTGDLLQL